MKASLITIHVGFNFGSILQTIASVEVLKKQGLEVKIVNYIPNRVRPKYFLSGADGVLRKMKRLAMLPNFLRNRRIYQGYLGKYCTLSEPIYTSDTFGEKCPKADLYVTGSDQVWNSIHNEGLDVRYFFEGIKGRFISLASSFGREQISEKEADYVKIALLRYSAISVREESAVNLLSDLDINSVQLLDPTFYLNRFDWEPFMSKPKFEERYLLVYAPYNIVDEAVIYKSARKIAKKLGLKVVAFSWDFNDSNLADHTVKYASPGDFLRLMRDADYVITNSFHGTAFSINLNKQFIVFRPSSFFTRIESVLSLCGLTGRVAEGVVTDEIVDDIIDYEHVNKVLDKERGRAMQFLANCI